MRIGVRKEPGIHGGGYHYMTHPIEIQGAREAAIFEQMGHVVLEVPDEEGKRILEQARAALSHQVRVAFLVEAHLRGAGRGKS